VLELLSDGKAHSHHEIYALNVIAHSRISELRNRRGYGIEQWREEDARTGETVYFYRLVSEPVSIPAAARAEALRRPAPKSPHSRRDEATVETMAAVAAVTEGAAETMAAAPGPSADLFGDLAQSAVTVGSGSYGGVPLQLTLGEAA
jgi:hypothetical protein